MQCGYGLVNVCGGWKKISLHKKPQHCKLAFYLKLEEVHYFDYFFHIWINLQAYPIPVRIEEVEGSFAEFKLCALQQDGLTL